ncbi:hypothetical protein CALCODRAFT_533997 [Calocera cornea HHB12733]|uniref:Uncharacterized protein n=1 Tax=Calocera cornea HHB12733 TaxID=1353952 RepID=A0A165CS50_9BASI|nr:hypothetical protein CALCODRAFT_533997 [Calocera cornea HHB12733]
MEFMLLFQDKLVITLWEIRMTPQGRGHCGRFRVQRVYRTFWTLRGHPRWSLYKCASWASTRRTQHRLTRVIDLTRDPADEAYNERKLHCTGVGMLAVRFGSVRLWSETVPCFKTRSSLSGPVRFWSETGPQLVSNRFRVSHRKASGKDSQAYPHKIHMAVNQSDKSLTSTPSVTSLQGALVGDCYCLSGVICRKECGPPSVAFENMGSVTSRSSHLQTLQQAPDDDISCFPAEGHAVIEQGVHEASQAGQGGSTLKTVARCLDTADDSSCRRSISPEISLYDHCLHGTASAFATKSPSNIARAARELALDRPTNDTNAANGLDNPVGMDSEKKEEVSFLKYLQSKASS